MHSIEFIVRSLNASGEMLKMTLADMSDADLLTRPCPSANHPLWQLGHLCVAETNLLNGFKPNCMPELPSGFADRFANKKTNNIDDPKLLATKQQVVDLFVKTRQATIAAVQTLSESDLDKPAPEQFRKFFATIGDLVNLQTTHVMMHLGQIQVARRKLGKPVLF